MFDLRRRRRLGLALSGGAVRGFAHIGALKALEEAGLEPTCVAGTSAGSLVGALYCAGLSWREILAQARDLEWKDLISPCLPALGFFKTDGLEKKVERLTGGRNIEDLPLAFRAVAVDLVSGREVVFDRGPIGRAVRASCSIPAIFTPLIEDERVLVDGGVLNSLPSDVVRSMGADYVIGVDLNSDTAERTKKPGNVVEVMLRSTMIFMSATNTKGLSYSDSIVRPDMSGFSYHDMSRLEEMVARGEQAAREAISRIRVRLR